MNEFTFTAARLRALSFSLVSPVLFSTFADAAPLLRGASQVSTGITHTCATMLDGTAACWGDNSEGEIGNGTGSATPVLVPTSVMLPGATHPKLSGMVSVGAGYEFTCGLHSSGVVYCWGSDNFRGSLGSGGTPSSLFPERAWISEPVSEIAVGSWHACALLNNAAHSVRCWGDNRRGQIGDGTTTDRFSPVDVVITERDGTRKLLTDVRHLSAGGLHTCAILADSSIACWGSNYYRELGDGEHVDYETSPVAVVISEPDGSKPKLTGVSQVTAGFSHTCAMLAATMSGACWGDNVYGEFGVPSGLPIYSASPIAIPDLGVRQLSAGEQNTCAVLADGRVSCWGEDWDGQIGVGTMHDDYYAPQMPAIATAKMISAGSGHTCAVMADSGVKCWGSNYDGTLGDGSVNSSSVPVDVLAVSP